VKSAARASTSAIFRAGDVTFVAAVVRATAPPVSSTVPHDWHSGHRPTHFTVLHPHSLQRYAGELFADRDVFAAMLTVFRKGWTL
jgi:hypothetical protein